MELKLYEKFILLAINSEKERFTGSHTFLRYALAGAFLYDLYLQDKITLIGNKIKINKYNLSGNRVLDDILRRINESRKDRIVRYWIYKIGYRSFRFRKKILAEMSMKSMIKISDHRFMGFIPYKKYKILKPKLKEQIIGDAINDLFKNKSIARENLFLLSLMDYWMMRRIFPERNQRKTAKKEIREFVRQNSFSRVIIRAITRLVARHRSNGVVISASGI